MRCVPWGERNRNKRRAETPRRDCAETGRRVVKTSATSDREDARRRDETCGCKRGRLKSSSRLHQEPQVNSAARRYFGCRSCRLFFQCARVSNQRFDFVVGKFSAEGFHGRFAVLFDTVFDRLGGLRVTESGLNFWICQILRVQLLSHLRIGPSILPMTLRAIIVPISFHL